MFKNGILVAALVLSGWLLFGYQAVDRAQTLTIGGPFEFSSEDLAKDGYIFTRMQVAETLVEVQVDGTLAPKLASGWQVSEDGLQWWFSIREGIRFHDGEALTTQSVLFSLQQLLDKPGVFQQLPLDALSIQNNQIHFQLKQPFTPLLSILAHFSTAILSPNAYDDTGKVIHLQGTGPYQVDEIAPPHKLNVRRFAHYWGKPALIEQAHYLTGHRAESRAIQAQSGQADLIYTLDPASLKLLESASNVTLYSASIPRTVLIKLNNEHRFLAHPDVRRALSLAIDREGIAEHIVRVPGSQAYQLFPPALPHWHLNDLKDTQRALAKAQQLLAEQGWQRASDGVLVRGGERFVLDLLTYADRPELTVIATAIQAQLRELGISINISIDNSSAIPRRHHDGTLELALIARNFGTISDPLALLIDDNHSHKGSDWGAMNWSSDPLNTLLQRMVRSNGQDTHALSQQAARHLAQQMPLIPVVFYTQQVAINKRVNNFQFDPFENNYRIAEMSLAH